MTDEQVLITRAQRGDTDAFRELVERSKINVYRLAYDMTGSRHDAEDLSQEVFVKAYRALPKFRSESKWSTWLYRITTNVCIDHNRSRSKTMEYRDALTSDDATSEPNHPRSSSNPDRSTEASMIQRNIEQALGQLAPQERSVFVLRHYHDLPLKEIAATMEISEGTVKSYLFRALQRLRRELAFYKKDLGLEGQHQ